jgi:hypothetical protein
MAGLIATLHHFGTSVSTRDTVPALAVAGCGFGAVIAPLANVILSVRLRAGRELRVRRAEHQIPARQLDRARRHRVIFFGLTFALMLALPGMRRHLSGPRLVQEASRPVRGKSR